MRSLSRYRMAVDAQFTIATGWGLVSAKFWVAKVRTSMQHGLVIGSEAVGAP